MSKQTKLKAQPQLFCLNPFCKSRTSHPRSYSQRGLTMHLKVSPACSRFVNCQYTQKPPSLSWLSEVSVAKSAFVTRRVPASSPFASANVQTQVSSYAAD